MDLLNKNVVIIENTYYTVLTLRMEIIEKLQNEGYTVYVLSSGSKEDHAELFKRKVLVRDIGSIVNNPIHLIQYVRKIFLQLKEVNPFIVFTFTIRPNLFGSLVACHLNIPVVANITGLGPVFENNNIVYKAARFLYRFALKENQTIFFQNKIDYSFFLQSGYVKANQAVLLPGSGVDAAYYAPASKNPDKAFTFLMISRLIKDKGIIEYIEAAKMISREFSSVRFELLGPYWTQNLTENTITETDISSWQKQGAIDYLGSTLDVRPFIAQSDCIVLPSYREGNSNVLMQGASMAKPCIASDVVGCNNLIIDNESGYLCKVKDIEDLYSKMKKMITLSEEQRSDMGIKGREHVSKNYPKAIVVDAYLYECLKAKQNN